MKRQTNRIRDETNRILLQNVLNQDIAEKKALSLCMQSTSRGCIYLGAANYSSDTIEYLK